MQALAVRFRGIGDVLISWFAIESLAKQYDVIYCTSPVAARLFPDDWVAVETFDWKMHPLKVSPRLPKQVMDIEHDKLYNLVNAVDWRDTVADYDTVSRARLFANLMGVHVSSYVRPVKVTDEGRAFGECVFPSTNATRIVCQVSAKSETRLWPHWKRLAKILVKRGHTVIWCGEPQCFAPDGVINMTGITTLDEWVGILAGSDIIISTCTSATHIGARIPTTKVLALYGSTDYRLFTEFYTNVKPITGYFLPCAPCADWQRSSACYAHKLAPWCLLSISAYQVAYEVEKILS